MHLKIIRFPVYLFLTTFKKLLTIKRIIVINTQTLTLNKNFFIEINTYKYTYTSKIINQSLQ